MALSRGRGTGPGALGTGTLAVPGGGVARLLRDSPTFGPQIDAGSQAQGVQPGTTLYEQFFRDAQTAVDSGDPLNFIALATAAHPDPPDPGRGQHDPSAAAAEPDARWLS